MKIIYNKFIPFRGYKAINLFGFVFARGYINEVDKRHEAIHSAQGRELLWIGFYLLYGLEWFIKCFTYGYKRAYWNISFEREAYENEQNRIYLRDRKKFSWILYL